MLILCTAVMQHVTVAALRHAPPPSTLVSVDSSVTY